MSRVEVIGDATLYLGDCAEILPTLGAFDAAVFDPPYRFATAGAGKFRKARKGLESIIAAGLDQGFDLDLFGPAQFRSLVVFCHNDQLVEILPRLKARYHRHVVLTWHKTNALPVANKHYRPDTEFWIHAWLEGSAPVGTLAEKARWIEAENGRHSGVAHPTVKPDAVMDKVLATVNARTICDPYMGSGSTGRAALKRGMRFVGIEIDPTFFDIACGRIEAAAKAAEMAGAA